jgi:molybdate transport system substrate-binding protein
MMKRLDIYCAGAAKAVTRRAIDAWREESGGEIDETYGAVGFLKNRLLEGGRPDLIILTAALIDELAASGLVRPGSRIDLGAVGTGIAVRSGAPAPVLATEEDVRAALLAASRIVCPDPAVATAGQVLVDALDKLGIARDVSSRIEFTPSGYAAMDSLAAGTLPGEVGVMQITEIIAHEGVSLAAALPQRLQRMTIYSAGLAANSDNSVTAAAFLDRLAGPAMRDTLRKAGFEQT